MRTTNQVVSLFLLKMWKGESTIHPIMLSQMEVSYCIFFVFCIHYLFPMKFGNLHYYAILCKYQYIISHQEYFTQFTSEQILRLNNSPTIGDHQNGGCYTPVHLGASVENCEMGVRWCLALYKCYVLRTCYSLWCQH